MGRVRSPMNLFLNAADYDTLRHRNVLILNKINKTDMVIRTWRMVRIPNAYGCGESRIINPDSLTVIYVNL